jgi:hypothetical protein
MVAVDDLREVDRIDRLREERCGDHRKREYGKDVRGGGRSDASQPEHRDQRPRDVNLGEIDSSIPPTFDVALGVTPCLREGIEICLRGA